MKQPGSSVVNFSVFFTSFSILGYEITFTRIFAWSQWVNLSPLIITMALLGFGASGSIVSVFQNRILNEFTRYFFGGLLLFPLSLAIGILLSTQLVINPYEITFSGAQIIGMFLYFSFMGVCFFLGALVICMAFLKYSISRTYFYNLLGSGSGALFVVGVSYFLHPVDIMAVVILISLVSAVAMAIHISTRYLYTTAAAAMVIVTILGFLVFFPGVKKVSQYKSISAALNLPNAQIVHEAYSPLGVVQVAQADGLRSTKGLSLVSPFPIPEQKGIFFNGDSMSPIAPFGGRQENIRHLGQIATYLPFYVTNKGNRNQVLIIGAGGGESILKAILSDFRQIDVLEVDSNVISLMKNQFSQYSGQIYNRENVRVLNQEARSFIKQTQKKYDLIELSMIDAYNTAASGVYALNESYLYTVESIKEMIEHINETGLLAISRWVVTPARDNLKIFNMAITALQDMGIVDPGKHILAIRSLQTLTLLISRTPIPDEMIHRTKRFTSKRLFDLVYYPGIKDKELNRFIRLQAPIYHNAIQKLLSLDSGTFGKFSDFDIRAATDNRPYFYNFFKPSAVKYIKTYGPSQFPVTEWGYLILVIILLPVLIFSFVLIVLPLMITRQKITRMKKNIFAYFSLIAFGFFFIEMPIIQKMILFLGHPSFSLSVTIAGLLVFSGIGALFSEWVFPENRRIFLSTSLIIAITGMYLMWLNDIFSFFISFPIEQKIVLALIIIAPLGFFMGFPFPCALALLRDTDPFSVPWAWGINGFFSVISILLATILAIIYGFNTVILIALICYAFAGMLSCRFAR